MIPGKYNMICPQGSTFSQQLTYSIDSVAVDLTEYSARMQIREKHTSTSSIIELSTSNSSIVVESNGSITINISAAETTDFVAKDYVYDLELVSPSGVVTRLIEGKFVVTPEVTK